MITWLFSLLLSLTIFGTPANNPTYSSGQDRADTEASTGGEKDDVIIGDMVIK